MIQDKIRGSLIGGAAGDALGYAVEFMSLSSIQMKYGLEGITEYECDGLFGKASISDDTQMTMFTANGLLVGKNIIRRENITKDENVKRTILYYIYCAYRDWYASQLEIKSKYAISWILSVPEIYQWQAPGNTCLSALKSGEMGCIDEPINNSKGCGGVMRVAPLGLFCGDETKIEELDLLGAEAAAITHGHSLGYIPAAALVHMVNRIVYGKCRDVYAIWEDCEKTLQVLFANDGFLKTFLALTEKAVKLSKNNKTDVQNITKLGQGWVGEEAFAIALYCFLRYKDDFSKVMIASVNHDGDSDSTGAIAGNMAGAYIGYDAIPQQWKENLEMHNILLELADDLYEESTGEHGCTKEYYDIEI